MSSTNRGYDRHKADYYVTPHQPIRDFLSRFLEVEDIGRSDRLIWFDPCAGGDEDNPMSYPTVLEEAFEPTVITMDIREDSRAEIKGDFLTYENKGRLDVVITNPPFNLAMEIIQKSLEIVSDGGYVCMLLRLNFFGSVERNKFFQDNMPKYCFVHHKRISFIPESQKKKLREAGEKIPGSDSIEYAHFVWQKNHKTEFTKLFLI